MFAFVSSPAYAADEEPIATDRPDFVESSNVVGKGRIQIETSVARDRTTGRGDTETLWAMPTLLRFGIGETVELRLESDGALRQRSRTAGHAPVTERGYADTSLGMKWHAMDAVGNLPSVAVLLHADLSTGSTAFRGEGTRPTARVVAEWDLPHDLSLGIMPGIGHEKANGGTTFAIFGLVVGKALSERLRSFVEVSSPHIARAAHGGTEASLSVGAAYLLQKNVQIDTAFSHGLNGRTPDLGLTVGLSIKL
ncbi:transporter [Pseudoduganella lutea]|uniref:Transporter n=1 Tax=Pseudoduganella lutea TaxID=321985 RepID=A0A4P6L4C9_9BURK|nr:transporter [Pseudoduganella lutea]QBE66429.1 transporter [Pseudoduganella lutea]